MKKEIHPKYHTDSKVTCVCGSSFAVGSTLPQIKVEICSNCHPFYTGGEKVLDTAGRVERFKQRSLKASASKKK
ncbi:MAG TPA: 50S ribosomal protein L31 [Candidatus Paceibacterota bacterium]|nr:50S ribosomal protein L31 [Candidatus Paceibacterota bacterium]